MRECSPRGPVVQCCAVRSNHSRKLETLMSWVQMSRSFAFHPDHCLVLSSRLLIESFFPSFFVLFCFYLFISETGFLCVALSVLELTL